MGRDNTQKQNYTSKYSELWRPKKLAHLVWPRVLDNIFNRLSSFSFEVQGHTDDLVFIVKGNRAGISTGIEYAINIT